MSLAERAAARRMCGRCGKRPHNVRVRVEVREKDPKGSGRMVVSSYASLCDLCALAVLDTLYREPPQK